MHLKCKVNVNDEDFPISVMYKVVNEGPQAHQHDSNGEVSHDDINGEVEWAVAVDKKGQPLNVSVYIVYGTRTDTTIIDISRVRRGWGSKVAIRVGDNGQVAIEDRGNGRMIFQSSGDANSESTDGTEPTTDEGKG